MGVFESLFWSKFCINIWSKMFLSHFPYLYSGLGLCVKSQTVCMGCEDSVVNKLSGCLQWGFQKEMAFLFCFFMLEKDNTSCVWKGTKRAFLWTLFALTWYHNSSNFFENPENTMKWSFGVHWVNPKVLFLFKKSVFEGVSERLLTICDPERLCSAENTFASNKTQLLQKKGVSRRKQKIYQKWWIVFWHAQRCFLV